MLDSLDFTDHTADFDFFSNKDNIELFFKAIKSEDESDLNINKIDCFDKKLKIHMSFIPCEKRNGVFSLKMGAQQLKR